MIVIAVTALTLIGLLYALLWYPLNSSIQSQRSAIETKTGSLAFLNQSIPTLAGLRAGGGIQKETNKSPFQLQDQITDELESGKPERAEPVGDKKVRMSFNNVAFDKLVSVIAELELYGVQVDTINVTRKKDTGYVSARMTMVGK